MHMKWCLWCGLTKSAFGKESSFSRREDSFTLNLLYLKKAPCESCTMNKICKHNAAINRITGSTRVKSIPVNFDGSYYASYITVPL
jgi:hypothetical protein